MEKRLDKLKEVIFSRPYIYILIVVFILYLTLNVIINQVYVTAPLLFTYNLKIIIPYIIFSLLIAFLVGLNINLLYYRYREAKAFRKEGSVTFVGVFGGLLGGACPSCFVGLFPAFIGLFGITASLSSLPFLGLEIQIFSVLILGIATIFLTREQKVCKVKIKK